MEGTLWNKL